MLSSLTALATGFSGGHAGLVDNLAPFEIAPGVVMPALNLGHPDDSTDVASGVELWVSLGGTGMDTAYDYNNQQEVAAGIKGAIAKGASRKDLFLTTKISPSVCTREAALNAVKEDVKELGNLVPDLVLHHFPCERHHAMGSNADVWKGLQDALSQGLTRSIGVSNYEAKELNEVFAVGGVKPALNQCAMSIGSHDDATIAFCKSHNITYEAYSPLRHLNLTDARITPIASAHNVSTAQVALRWISQQGIVVATSPGMKREYVVEDLALGDFTLTDGEMATLSAI